jgi:hypothetical protein
LTVIGGRSRIAAMGLEADDPRRHHLELITETVDRAAGLTRRSSSRLAASRSWNPACWTWARLWAACSR